MSTQISLPYGKGVVDFCFPHSQILHGVNLLQGHPLKKVPESLLAKLENPTCGMSLRQLLAQRKPKKISIILNDSTRSTPTALMLETILPYLQQASILPTQIQLVIATGTHRGATEAEIIQLVGKEVATKYRVISHDCKSSSLVHMGNLSTMNPLFINQTVADADFRISIGEIQYHYYAGYAGGRKCILPGVSDYHSIQVNHARMNHPCATYGSLLHNPVHEEMIDALRLCPVDFMINVVCNEKKEIQEFFTGDIIKAWEKGVAYFTQWNDTCFSQKADVVIASAGGYPQDINLYQAHKAMEMSSCALRENGKLLLIAECPEKYGHPVFQKYAQQKYDPDTIQRYFTEKFEFGLHKLFYLAKLRKKYDLFLYSSFPREETEEMWMKKVDSLSVFVQEISPHEAVYIVPQGGKRLPKMQNGYGVK